MLNSKLALAMSAFALVFSACAHPISTHMTANRFDSPEASGKFGNGDFGGGFESGPQYMITPDSTGSPVDLSHPSFSHSDLDAFLAGDLGILNRLDVGLKIRFNNTLLGQIKYQFIGEPRLDAKEGNFSLAATFAGGGSNYSDTSTSVGLFGGTPITATTTLTETDTDAAVVAGYRFTNSGLVYGGPFWTRRTYSGDISQTGGATGTTALAGVIQDFGVNLGIQGNFDKALLRFEIVGSRASAGPLSYWSGYFGFNGAFFW